MGTRFRNILIPILFVLLLSSNLIADVVGSADQNKHYQTTQNEYWNLQEVKNSETWVTALSGARLYALILKLNKNGKFPMAQDAYPFPDGNQMAFHILRAGNLSGAAMAIMNMDGTNFRRLTDWNGSGHGIVNSTGQEIVYSSSQTGIPEGLRVNDPNSGPVVIPLPSSGEEGIPYDIRFGPVAKIHWSYPAWANDDHSLFLSAQGSSESNVLFFFEIALRLMQ